MYSCGGRCWSIATVQPGELQAVELPVNRSWACINSNVALEVGGIANADQKSVGIEQATTAASVDRSSGDLEIRGRFMLVVFVDTCDACVTA